MDSEGARQPSHVPVMLERVLELLGPALVGRDAICVDATVGLAGHTEALLAQHPGLTLIGLDRDPEALRRSADRLAAFSDRIHLVHTIYSRLTEVLASLGHQRVDAVLFDLGVSSLQLDEVRRGFAYSQDAPLDMRMDPTRGPTAQDVVNGYPVTELRRIFAEYGEERFAARIATRIERERSRHPITSSVRLAELVRDSIPAPARRTGGHPAKRVFQALRIEVNGELDAVRDAIPAAVDALATGGRIVVLAYHSLEDRIVKRTLAAGARSSAPVGLPFDPAGTEPVLRLLTRGAERPGEAEVAANPRAASARLRAAERLWEAV
ncbi:MAG TPA: 16S rRNA (cytosine(1402)-N(4))-methyltransferase RsmH [Micromonosporaceae bacterium]